jgi:hypothetical protein
MPIDRSAALGPEAPVQRQLDAYNAHDLDRFVAEYSDDVCVFRAPSRDPVFVGKAAFAAHYRANRFNLPSLHADVLGRMIVGNKVIDHERVHGVSPVPFEVAVVYEVVAGSIRTVWFFDAA